MSLEGKKLIMKGTINLALLEIVAGYVGCKPEQVTKEDIEKAILDGGARGTGFESLEVTE